MHCLSLAPLPPSSCRSCLPQVLVNGAGCETGSTCRLQWRVGRGHAPFDRQGNGLVYRARARHHSRLHIDMTLPRLICTRHVASRDCGGHALRCVPWSSSSCARAQEGSRRAGLRAWARASTGGRGDRTATPLLPHTHTHALKRSRKAGRRPCVAAVPRSAAVAWCPAGWASP